MRNLGWAPTSFLTRGDRDVGARTARLEKEITHPDRIRRRNLVDLPDEVLEVGDVPRPIVAPVIPGIDDQERLPDPARVVRRPRIAVLLAVGTAVGRSGARRGVCARRLLESIVPHVCELERRVGARLAGYVLGEVRKDVWVEADVVVLAEDAGEADGLGHGRVIPYEEDALEAYAIHLVAKDSLPEGSNGGEGIGLEGEG